MQKSQKSSAAGRPACDKSNVTEPAAPPQSNFAIFGTNKNVCESVNINTIFLADMFSQFLFFSIFAKSIGDHLRVFGGIFWVYWARSQGHFTVQGSRIDHFFSKVR